MYVLYVTHLQKKKAFKTDNNICSNELQSKERYIHTYAQDNTILHTYVRKKRIPNINMYIYMQTYINTFILSGSVAIMGVVLLQLFLLTRHHYRSTRSSYYYCICSCSRLADCCTSARGPPVLRPGVGSRVMPPPVAADRTRCPEAQRFGGTPALTAADTAGHCILYIYTVLNMYKYVCMYVLTKKILIMYSGKYENRLDKHTVFVYSSIYV